MGPPIADLMELRLAPEIAGTPDRDPRPGR
jgi:hypothetical protein